MHENELGKGVSETERGVALRQCISQGDELGILCLLNDGLDPNIVVFSGMSALRWAVEQGKLDIARLLIDRGADPTDRSSAGPNGRSFTALHQAASENKLEYCRLLLDAGADPCAKAGEGSLTPLHLAIEHGMASRSWVEVCRLLLERGADPNAVSTCYYDPANRKQYSRKQRLEDDEGHRLTPLHLAIQESDKIEYLVLEEPHNAQWGSGAQVIRLLLQHGADPNLMPADAPSDYLTPVQLAVKTGQGADVQVLLACPEVDIAQRSRSGRTLLQLAGPHAAVKGILLAAKTAKHVADSVPDGAQNDLDGQQAGRQNGRSNGMSPL